MFDVVCTKKIYARRQQGDRMMQKAKAVTHRLLYFPEIYWFLPKNSSRDYLPLAPSHHIRKEVPSASPLTKRAQQPGIGLLLPCGTVEQQMHSTPCSTCTCKMRHSLSPTCPFQPSGGRATFFRC